MKRAITALVAGAALMLVIGACGATDPPPWLAPWLVRYYAGLPPGVTGQRDDAVWTATGRLAVVTYGSSSCPGLPMRLDLPASNRLRITVQASSSGPCTADLAPTTSIIEVPKALDVTQDVTVTIVDGSYGAAVSVPPRAGAG